MNWEGWRPLAFIGACLLGYGLLVLVMRYLRGID